MDFNSGELNHKRKASAIRLLILKNFTVKNQKIHIELTIDLEKPLSGEVKVRGVENRAGEQRRFSFSISQVLWLYESISILKGVEFKRLNKIISSIYKSAQFSRVDNHGLLNNQDVNSILEKVNELKEQISPEKLHKNKTIKKDERELSDDLDEQSEKSNKDKILVKSGMRVINIPKKHISYIIVKNGLNYIVDYNCNKFLIESTLSEIFSQLGSARFQRINRQCIVNIDAIKGYSFISGSRIKVEVINQLPDTPLIVSFRQRKSFLEWITKHIN